MNRKEAKSIYEDICNAYPSYKPIDPQKTFDIIAAYLMNYPYASIKANLDYYICNDTSGYAPTVGQLICNRSSKSFSFERAYTHEDFEELEKIALKGV